MSDDSREPPATLAVDGSAPPSVPRSSPRASPEPSAPLEHEHEHEDEDDRDELEDEGEDAASSEGRARTPDPPSAAPASSLDSVSAAASEAAKSVMPVGGKTQAAFVHKCVSHALLLTRVDLTLLLPRQGLVVRLAHIASL